MIRGFYAAPVFIALAWSIAMGQAFAADGVSVPSQVEEGAAQLVRGDVAKAVATYTEALKDTGLANDRRATILNDRGVANVRLGETKLALEDYNRAVELFPEYPVAYNNRGNLLLALGQYSEATKDFDRAIVLAPGYAAAYSNRGNARMKAGKTRDAILDFTKAIELMPASAPPLSGRGLAYLTVGKPHAAIRDFSRAVNADARFASAYRNRAEARLAVGQSEEAIEDLSRAVAFDVSNSELYVVRGYAYLLGGNTASAIKDFSRAIELDAKSSAAYEGRGLSNGIAEASDDAYADLNRAIELDPRSPVAFAFRAFVYKQSGQPDIGAKDVQTAIKLDANSPEALWARGEIEEATGQADTAITDLRRVLQLRPSWRFASDALKRLGASADDADDKAVPSLDLGKWHVVQHGKDYVATSDEYPQIRVPLEMTGEGLPKLLDWEVRPPPYAAYGILRFSGGRVPVKGGGFEDAELAALVDIAQAKVIAIEPHKQGNRVATWTWDGDSLLVASVDGATDQYQLRPVNVAVVGQRRPYGAGQAGTAGSWDQPFGFDPTPKSEQRSQRRSKPKSIFDLLFGN
ncbi:tetratricopeptide repeat protein [Hyphomicrobium sp. 99]|uniref:tetratricopeptide repeat protein n=1 Tax=Hyphomicrobium sp. 99 TaxID=1163419 RepID=UPI0005F83884|nr:tetratricopeptide repeat protein [Hyphomicrobium sp. 99]